MSLDPSGPYAALLILQAARTGLKGMERAGLSSETAAFCPTCRRATIRRASGEWCRWCRGWVEELVIYQGTERVSAKMRVLGSYRV